MTEPPDFWAGARIELKKGDMKLCSGNQFLSRIFWKSFRSELNSRNAAPTATVPLYGCVHGKANIGLKTRATDCGTENAFHKFSLKQIIVFVQNGSVR